MRQNGNLNPGPPSLLCPYLFQSIFPVAEFKPDTFRGVHLNGIVNFVVKISLGIKHSSQNILPEKKKKSHVSLLLMSCCSSEVSITF